MTKNLISLDQKCIFGTHGWATAQGLMVGSFPTIRTFFLESVLHMMMCRQIVHPVPDKLP